MKFRDRRRLALARAFEDTTLPKREWTHAAHLTVALVFARRWAPDEALARLRDGIKRYNRATGTPETGYHETITAGWFRLVLHFLQTEEERPLGALADALVARHGSKLGLLAYWSREILMSREARARWVEPDRATLPLTSSPLRAS